jgi:hypothetical protein
MYMYHVIYYYSSSWHKVALPGTKEFGAVHIAQAHIPWGWCEQSVKSDSTDE